MFPCQANTSVKTIEGHYVRRNRPQKLQLNPIEPKPLSPYLVFPDVPHQVGHHQGAERARDVDTCSGYVAGCNTLFFGEKTANDNGGCSKASGRRSRTPLVDAPGEYESMLAFPSTKQAANRDQVISITDRLLPWEVTKNATDQYSYFPGGAAVKAVYGPLYGLDSIHFGEDIRAAEAQEFISQVHHCAGWLHHHSWNTCWMVDQSVILTCTHLHTNRITDLTQLLTSFLCSQGSLNNSTCFIGPHRVHSPWSNTFFDLTPGQGHFGPDALPGDARYAARYKPQTQLPFGASLSLV